MYRFIRICLVAMLLLVGGTALTGCVVVPARGHSARVWVPGYWAPPHIWVRGGWRYR